MAWDIIAKRKVQKQVDKLPDKVKAVLNVLLAAIRNDGPVRHEWPNYGRLGENIHHLPFEKRTSHLRCRVGSPGQESKID